MFVARSGDVRPELQDGLDMNADTRGERHERFVNVRQAPTTRWLPHPSARADYAPRSHNGFDFMGI
jgi:hypothetical protein